MNAQSEAKVTDFVSDDVIRIEHRYDIAWMNYFRWLDQQCEERDTDQDFMCVAADLVKVGIRDQVKGTLYRLSINNIRTAYYIPTEYGNILLIARLGSFKLFFPMMFRHLIPKNADFIGIVKFLFGSEQNPNYQKYLEERKKLFY